MLRYFTLAFSVALLAQCATTGPPSEPVVEPPFETRLEPTPAKSEFASLAGRRICIDPGHGGPWPGAVAPSNEIRECDVNLDVALRLRAILLAHGAATIMTRTADVALAPDSLSADLAARAAAALEHDAHVFVSIHHNADVRPLSGKNDLEVYYRWTDDGPSLDLAQCLTHHLARSLRRNAREKRLLAGNYKVLRLLDIPAALIESSYLTDAANAAFLATPEARAAEAEAIAAGLAAYFALDPPRVASAAMMETAQPGIYQCALRFERGFPIDRSTVSVVLDGRPARGFCDFGPKTLRWTLLEPPGNGSHEVEFQARNFRGAAVRHVFNTDISRPAAHLIVRQIPVLLDSDSSAQFLLETSVLDGLGRPVQDGTAVTLGGTSHAAHTINGKARFYLDAADVSQRYTFHAGDASASYAVRFGGPAHKSLRFREAEGNAAAPSVLVQSQGHLVGVATQEGWLAVAESVEQVTASRAGYEPALAELKPGHNEIRLRPVNGGALHGRHILLDPAHGGRDPGAVGPFGGRSSDVSRDVARRAASYLRGAGATVSLTREGDADRTPAQRVLMAQLLAPDIFITVSFGSPPATARLLDLKNLLKKQPAARFAAHYPGSAHGMKLAKALAEAFGVVDVNPSAAFVLQQTPCPAVIIQPEHVTTLADGPGPGRASYCRDAAYGLYKGILRYFRNGVDGAISSSE